MVLVAFINLFFGGILAGMEVSIHYGLHAGTIDLDQRPQIVLRQRLVQRLRWLVPLFFIPTALSGVVVAIIGGAGPGLYARIGGLFAIFVWILVRIVGTVRINSATLEWDASAPPPDWRRQINKAERFHVVGTWAAVLAFACFLIAARQWLGRP